MANIATTIPVIVSQTCPLCLRDGESATCVICNGTNLIHYEMKNGK